MFSKNNQPETKEETREERFKRVATRRVQEILNKLRLLGNCSEKANYRYDEAQIKKIFSTIEERVKEVRAKFNHGARSKKSDNFVLE